MGAIDIGPGAADYNYRAAAAHTCIDFVNPANATGILDTFEIWQQTAATGVKVGTFYGTGVSYTNRDYELIGDVSAGSKQVFTGKSCDCQTGDLIGWYSATGDLETHTSGGIGVLYIAGDKFGAGSTSYDFVDDRMMALYGTGVQADIPLFVYHYNNMRP